MDAPASIPIARAGRGCAPTVAGTRSAPRRCAVREEQVVDVLESGRPIVARAAGDARAQVFVERSLERFRALQPAAPRFRHRYNEGLFTLGVPALAMYRALRDDLGLDQ